MPLPKPEPPADRAWMARARCRAGVPEWWFPEGRVGDDDRCWDLPRSWCMTCQVRGDCRAWIDQAEHGQPRAHLYGTGMWAGETPTQRIARRKGRPAVDILDEGTGGLTRIPPPPAPAVDRAALDRDTAALARLVESCAALAHAIQYACEDAADGWQVSDEAWQWANGLEQLLVRVREGLPWTS